MSQAVMRFTPQDGFTRNMWTQKWKGNFKSSIPRATTCLCKALTYKLKSVSPFFPIFSLANCSLSAVLMRHSVLINSTKPRGTREPWEWAVSCSLVMLKCELDQRVLTWRIQGCFVGLTGCDVLKPLTALLSTVNYVLERCFIIFQHRSRDVKICY